MTIGEIVEVLIYIRDMSVVLRSDKDALADACNILDELPGDWKAEEARVMLRWLRDHSRMVRKEE